MEDKIQPIRKEDHTKIHRWKKLAIISSFLIIVGILVYTAFIGDFSFTGELIEMPEPDLEDAIKINAKLNFPETFSLKGKSSSVKLKVLNNSGLSFGDSLFNLSSGDSIYLNGYEGEISFNENKILILEGNSRTAVINDVSVSPKNGKPVPVSLGEVSYILLNVSNIYIKEINYDATGLIRVGDGKDVVRPRNENVLINKFKGNVGVSRGELVLDGKTENIKVKGHSEISVS